MRGLSRRLMSAAVAACLCIPASALAAPQGLKDPDAIAHADAAAEAAAAEDYDTAIRHLKAAYAIEQEPLLLYAWAQAERLSGNYRASISLYQAFLEQHPDGEIANKARVNLLDARSKVREEAENSTPAESSPEDETDDEQDTPPPPDEDEDEDETPSPLKGEKLAPALLGIGAAVTITGGVLMGLGRSRVANADSQPTEEAYFTELDASRNLYYAGAATLGAGGLIMIGGAIRYILVAKRGKTPKSTASTMVIPRGFGLTFSGRF
jgi:tetratricopeptide (TPR) repeat protein